MKSKKVWLTCGVPGSGKSTWVQEQIAAKSGVWCSRDKVRFSLLQSNDDYFAKEDLVLSIWLKNIQTALDDAEGPANIFVDATHLNPKARKKVISQLNLENADVIAVNFLISLDTCLERNDLRDGRAFVPRSVIRRMFYSFEPAAADEGFDEIITITD